MQAPRGRQTVRGEETCPMKKRVSGFFIIVAVVVMLPAARVQAGTVPGLFGTEGYYVRLPFRRDLSFSRAKARRGQAEKGLRCLPEKGWPRAPSSSTPVVVAFTAAAFLQQLAASPFRLATPSSLEWWPILATTLSAAIRCGESTPPLKSQRGSTTTTNRRRSHDQTNA